MTLKHAIARIEELERKVKELESRPPVTDTHFHYQQPNYSNPAIGDPYVPSYPQYQIWCSAS